MAQDEQAKKTLVLLVEDEPALNEIYTIKLNNAGMEVISTFDGVAGLDAALANMPAIILLDLIMPLKDGYEVLRDLKSNPKTKDIPVIIFSNLGQDYEVKRGMALGALRFMVKAETNPDDLIRIVKEALAGQAKS
jgi:DNA-binding response OmpR family regulator